MLVFNEFDMVIIRFGKNYKRYFTRMRHLIRLGFESYLAGN